MHESLYDILGVARDADVDTLRKRYHTLARQLHPDVAPDDAAAEERFKKTSHAYEVLSDPERRSQYDEFGAISLEPGFDPEAARASRGGFSRFGGPSSGPSPGAFDLENLLGGLFGGSGFAAASAPGPDVHARIEVDFETALRGGEQSVVSDRPTATGSVERERLTVRLPPGIRDGGSLRLRGRGGIGPSGSAGDLLLSVRVRPHRALRRVGRDLHLELPVTFREVALGARVAVPTLDGRATVTIPAGTQGGSKLRLRGKGVPASANRPAGDLIANVRIRVPLQLDEAGREAVAALERYETSGIRDALFDPSERAQEGTPGAEA